MSALGKSGKVVHLEEVAIWYDGSTDTCHLTSGDADLPPGGFHMNVKRGTRTDTSIRSILERHGLVARPFEPEVPGQVTPIVLGGTKNLRELRAALLPERRLGRTQINWSPGISDTGVVDDEWRSEPSLLVTGEPKSGKTSLIHSMITQVVKKNGPDAVEVVILDSTGELGAYGTIDTVDYHGGATAEDVANALDRGIEELERRAELFNAHSRRPREIEDAREIALNDSLVHGTRFADHLLAIPYLLIVVDGWDAITASSVRRPVAVLSEALERIVLRGRAYGVHVVLTAESGTAVPKKVADTTRRIFLRSEDRADATAAGVSAEILSRVPDLTGLLANPESSIPLRFRFHELHM